MNPNVMKIARHMFMTACGVLALLMVAPYSVAQPPVQVHVPSFTPVALQPTTVSVDPSPAVGMINAQDCQSEQDAWVQAKLEYAVEANNGTSTNPQLHVDYLKKLYFENGNWAIRLVDIWASRGMLKENLQYFQDRSRTSIPQCTEINSCVQAVSLRDSRLQHCLLNMAFSRGNQPIQTSVEPTPQILDCGADKTGLVNRELEDIDQQIATFLNSHLGQQRGTATPSLQVVMWGTSQQAKVMQQHCAGMDGFDARIKELKSAFNAAQQACRQLQSNAEACEPFSPNEVLGAYEQAQKRAAERMVQQPATSNVKEDSGTSEQNSSEPAQQSSCRNGPGKGCSAI